MWALLRGSVEVCFWEELGLVGYLVLTADGLVGSLYFVHMSAAKSHYAMSFFHALCGYSSLGLSLNCPLGRLNT